MKSLIVGSLPPPATTKPPPSQGELIPVGGAVGGDQEAEALTAVTINVVKKSGRKPSGAFVSTQDTLGKALANIKEQQ